MRGGAAGGGVAGAWPLTLVVGVAPQLLAEAALLEAEEALLLLLQPAQTSSPEHRVLLHQLLHALLGLAL